MGRRRASIYLTGAFRIEDASGQRVVLTGTKAQAILALLVTAPNGERSRTWLQARLWSDRGADQAAASLRQSLMQLRRACKDCGIELEALRKTVSVDLDTVEVIETPGLEFLEGMDLRDQGFEDWLREERMRRAFDADLQSDMDTRPLTTNLHRPVDESLRIHICVSAEITAPGRWFESIFADALSRSLREIFCAPVSVGPAMRAGSGAFGNFGRKLCGGTG